jgi:hypothetical protein
MSATVALLSIVPQIVARTPVWVWALLAALVVLGGLHLRTHSIRRPRVLLLPLAMGTVSLASAVAAFGPRAEVFAAWSLGLAMLLWWRPAGPRDVRHDPEHDRFVVGPSAVPLVLMLSVFAARYAVAVTRILQPELGGGAAFAIGVALAYGLLSGLFAARAVNILASARHVAARPSG